jgi:uncharacterized protein YlzI (FlbEa/FlbD family)
MAKFIKITQVEGKELLINADFIKIVEKSLEEEKGAIIYFNDGDTLEIQEDYLQIQQLANE